MRRPRVIKPTPLVTGPLEVARLGTTIQSVLHIMTWASALGFSFPKQAPGLAQAIEVALLLDASPKADGSDEIEYRFRGKPRY